MSRKNLDLDTIIQIVKDNPNNYKLGDAIRNYVNTSDYVDPNQLSIDFGDDGYYEDVDE